MAPEIRKRSARFLRSHSLPELGDRASSLVSSRSVSSGADSTDSLRLSQILATDNSPSTQSQARTSSSEHGSLHATSNNSADESCLRSTRRYREEDGGWSVPVPDADGVDGVSHTITNTVTFDTRPPSETSAGEEEIQSAAALFLHGRAAREGPGATHVQNRTISSKEELDPSLGVRIVGNVLRPAPLSGDQHVFKRDARKKGKKKIGLSGPAHQWYENRRSTPPLHEPSLPTDKTRWEDFNATWRSKATDAAKLDIFTTLTRSGDDKAPKTATLNIATAQRLVIAYQQRRIAEETSKLYKQQPPVHTDAYVFGKLASYIRTHCKLASCHQAGCGTF